MTVVGWALLCPSLTSTGRNARPTTGILLSLFVARYDRSFFLEWGQRSWQWD